MDTKIPNPNTKSREAFIELADMLKAFAADDTFQDGEIALLHLWRDKYRNILHQPALKPFSEWFNEALSDGISNAGHAWQCFMAFQVPTRRH